MIIINVSTLFEQIEQTLQENLYIQVYIPVTALLR